MPEPEKSTPSENHPGSANDNAQPDALHPSKTLSEEEQMARYEEALKEEDWGHQPC